MFADSVIDYLARYTHRISITNARILAVDNSGVALRYKDYRDGNRHKSLHLSGGEFVRRYLLHLLPKGFTRIRHYGFLAGCCRAQRLAQIRGVLATSVKTTAEETTSPYSEEKAYRCGHCKTGYLRPITELAPRPLRAREARRR
jgi:hypothetical protein